jgi:hypothetical protein
MRWTARSCCLTFANAPVVNPDLSFGITLHLQLDDAVPEGCGTGAIGFFGTVLDRLHEDCDAILKARELVFRYAIFGHDLAVDATGIAEIAGNDFMIATGGLPSHTLQAMGGTGPARRHPGGTFALGTTAVTCTASDASGNAVSGSFDVTVRDTTAPTISALVASPHVLWPSNHRLVPAALVADVVDVADPNPGPKQSAMRLTGGLREDFRRIPLRPALHSWHRPRPAGRDRAGGRHG